jgi:serine/threonine protein kinase
MHIGDVLRVGNSHLRLEAISAEEAAAAEAAAEEEGAIGVAGGDSGSQDSHVAATGSAADVEENSFRPHPPIEKLLALEGQTLGHFRIGPLLGRGQSGLVFRAVDTRNNNPVALKVLSPDFPASEGEMQRFIKALKTVLPLNHAHLVPLVGAGKTGAYCWIAREYVEGESAARLSQHLKESNRFDLPRICRIALHLGKALYFLHEHRLTHGNVTPRNVLVRQTDKVAKLADLVLNQALEGSGLQKAILGKKLLDELPYMPPEQTDPHDPVTPAADIYSLGAVLYLLLTGQPPFQGPTPRDVLVQIREGKVVRPSKLQKGIPGPFETLVLKMLARRPEDRFPSALELLADVETIAYAHGITA